jgi:uncharacterized protein YndB with AHSA1/START domain
MRMSELTTKPTVYVIYIAASPEKVWEALTSGQHSRRYFFGNSVESDWRVGSPFVLRDAAGQVHMSGRIVESDPPRRLAMTWAIEDMEEFRHLPACVVAYDIEPAGEAVKLTMTESHPEPVEEALLEGGRQGWPAILSSLKSLLETGKPLVVAMKPPQGMIEAARRAKARMGP